MKHILRVLTVGAVAVLLAASGAFAVDTTIYNIQQGLHLSGAAVKVLSVVIIGVDVKPSTYGVYVQESAGGAYSGILAFTGSTFPAYTPVSTVPAVGDVVNVEGLYTEFSGLSEITNPIFTKIGTTTPLVPIKLPVDSLKVNYAGSERWEGVLVRVDSVIVTSLNGFNDWRVHHFNGPVGGRVDSLVGYEKMVAGQVVPEVTDKLNVIGVADFAFSERRIAPRNDADITFLTPGPAAVPNLCYSPAENKIKVRFNVALNAADAQTTSKYSLSTLTPITSAVYTAATKTVLLTTSVNLTPSVTPHVLSISGIRNSQGTPMVDPQTISFIGGVTTIPFIQTPKSATNDTSQVVGQQVSFRGVCTGSTAGASPDFPPSIGGFYVQQRSATQYGGIFVFGSPSTPARGDSVFLSGLLTEFGVGPETELTSVDEMTVLGTNRPPITPPVVSLLNASGTIPAEAEKYESMLIKIPNVFSLFTGTFGTSFNVSQSLAGGDTLRVDNFAINDQQYAPWRGDNDDITGIIRFSGTAPFRRIEPRNWSEPPTGDIHVIAKANVSDAPPTALRTQLLQNQPNPFNPTTRIDFTLEHAGPVAVRIYDPAGKLVRTVFSGEKAAGLNSVTWDGKNDQGRQAGTGLYLYRLAAGTFTQTRKMMLLK